MERSREPGKSPSVFGIGSAPARPLMGVPVAWPVSVLTALLTAARTADGGSPRGARWTTTACASSGSPKSLVAVYSAWTAGELAGTSPATPSDWVSTGRELTAATTAAIQPATMTYRSPTTTAA